MENGKENKIMFQWFEVKILYFCRVLGKFNRIFRSGLLDWWYNKSNVLDYFILSGLGRIHKGGVTL